MTRGDLEPARGNVHVCKLVRELTNIQIRTVTAERENDSKCSCLTNALQLNERTNVGRKEGRKEGELGRKRERRNSYRERERALNSIRPETNNSGLCWIDTRISFPIAVYARSGQVFFIITLYGTDDVYIYNFCYNFIYLNKDKMSSTSSFLDRSFI